MSQKNPALLWLVYGIILVAVLVLVPVVGGMLGGSVFVSLSK